MGHIGKVRGRHSRDSFLCEGLHLVHMRIESTPENSAHAQFVNTPDSLRHRETVVMVLLPNCAAGLNIATIRTNITLMEDRPSNKELEQVIDQSVCYTCI